MPDKGSLKGRTGTQGPPSIRGVSQGEGTAQTKIQMCGKRDALGQI